MLQQVDEREQADQRVHVAWCLMRQGIPAPLHEGGISIAGTRYLGLLAFCSFFDFRVGRQDWTGGEADDGGQGVWESGVREGSCSMYSC
jgi:hypothetical protein